MTEVGTNVIAICIAVEIGFKLCSE